MVLDDFHPYILPEVMGAPIPAVNLAIIRAAREFCEKSLVWEVDIPSIAISNGVSEYDLSLPDESDLIHLTSVKLEGVTVCPGESQDGALRYRQPDLEHIELVPVPELGSGFKLLELRAALKPARNANKISHFLYNEWAEAIAFGALSILKRQQRQAWSDQQGALSDRQEFERKMSEAKNRALHGHAKGSVSVRRIPFGARHG